MTLTTTLILLLSLQYALYGAAWGVGATLLGLPRTAALHWMAYCVLGSLGAVVFLADEWLPLAISLPLRNLAILAAVMLVRRGTALFLRRDTNDLEQVLVFVLAALGLLLVGTEPSQQWVLALMLSTAIGWVLLRAGLEQINAVGREFSRLTGWVLGLPPLLLGVAFLGRAAVALMVLPDPEQLHVRSASHYSAALLVLLLLVSTLQQFSLLYIVILRMVLKLRHLSRQDVLTHLLNRRAWAHALQAERLRLRRAPQPTAVLVVDIDHFKAINDRHGHGQGDMVLVEVARCLERTARATDVVARLGGEEFGVLLPDTDANGAAEAAERLRLSVASLNLTVLGERIPVTVSVGVAVLAQERAATTSLTHLQAQADTALYAAKAAGRNQVVMAPTLDAHSHYGDLDEADPSPG